MFPVESFPIGITGRSLLTPVQCKYQEVNKINLTGLDVKNSNRSTGPAIKLVGHAICDFDFGNGKILLRDFRAPVSLQLFFAM